MRLFILSLLFFPMMVLLSAGNGVSDQHNLVGELRAGGSVLMIRHAFAPGSGDPPNFRIGDCSTQRNLDERGRSQAVAIGAWLRARGIEDARVFSSQWCRCIDTATLMDIGPVEQLPALNSFFSRPEDREPNLAALQEFLSKQPLDGKLIVLVTHFVTISAVTGEGVTSGEGVVLRLVENSDPEMLGRLRFGF
jgi:phosphohistidine phosphatase SixA